MKKILRTFAVVILVMSVFLWIDAGMNRGWTKTSVPKKTVDEVTGIEGISYESRFVPGLDFLGLAVLGAGILTGISFLCRSKTTETQ